MEKNSLTSYQHTEKSVVVYKSNDGTIQLEVQLYNDTVWLNRQQLSVLFDRDIKTIGKHIHNALDEELKGLSVVAKFATTASDGKTYQVEYYNLDMVLSIGYRVKSQRGIDYRHWANEALKRYLIKGYAFNQRLLYLEQKVAEHDQKIDFFVKTILPPIEGVFYDGQIFDAYISENLKLDLQKHNTQYQPIDIKVFKDSHDRFLIIDDDVYHIGASLKDLGKKMFAFSKMNFEKENILQVLLK